MGVFGNFSAYISTNESETHFVVNCSTYYIILSVRYTSAKNLADVRYGSGTAVYSRPGATPSTRPGAAASRKRRLCIQFRVRLVEISYTFCLYVQEAQLLMDNRLMRKINLLGRQGHPIKLGLHIQLRKLRPILSFCLFRSYNFSNN